MKILSRWRRPLAGDRPAARRVELTERRDPKHAALTKIPYPDALTATGQHLPDLEPNYPESAALITSHVERLAATGALDEFTMDVLANWIDATHETWTAQVHRDAEVQRSALTRLWGLPKSIWSVS